MEIKDVGTIFQTWLIISLSLVFVRSVDVQVKGLVDWHVKNNATNNAPQWSYSGSGIGTYSVCSIEGDRVDSYLSVPYIATYPANEIDIILKYTLKDCSSFNSRCTYKIAVYAMRNDAEINSQSSVNPITKNFNFIAYVKNDTSLSKTIAKEFTSRVKLELKGSKGVYISFRDIGICGSISGLNVQYKTCPTISGDLVKFQESAAPNSTVGVQKINGECVENGVPVTSDGNSFMDCYSNGTSVFYGKCHCTKGFEKKGDTCQECMARYYKDKVGNQACLKCGLNVEDGSLPRDKICKCKNGFFRPTAQLGVSFSNCEEPPSSPQNVQASKIDSTWAIINWKVPSKNGTGDQISYTVKANCEAGCNDKVNDIKTMNLSTTLTNLKTYTFYNVTVYSVNNVTKATDIQRHGKVRFRTSSGLPSEVREVKIIRNNDGSVTIKWREPASKGGPDLKYRIKYGGIVKLTTNTNITIKQTVERQEYDIQIDSHTSAGYSSTVEISVIIFGKDKKKLVNGIPQKIAIGVCVGLGIPLVIAIALAIYYKRRHPAHLKPVRLENGEVILPSGGIPVYVDPTTYQDLADAVREFAKELDRQWIQLERLIGGGEFGDVYKGSLHRPLEDERVVAIKTLKSNANKKARDDFLSEAAYMGQFENPNVISLEGVVVKDRPIMIIIEFMSNGSLDSYLQENDGKFTNLQLLGMARGVANGMTYLSELSFIHRDLAARNVLVDENMVCKVADFGMSRELTQEETYNTTGGKIPVRWTAPEAIQFKKFTTASDVWSYGILLWEILSYAERPYWDWGNYEVIERLASGYRLPPPMGCPKVVHDLMLSCWHKDRVKRPKFRDVRATIDKWIRNPELMKQEASVVTRRDENLDYASMKTLKEWLDSIKMGQYIENFTNKDLVTPRQILELTDENLKEIGILAIGHRNKIMKSISATKGQMNELTRTKSMAV